LQCVQLRNYGAGRQCSFKVNLLSPAKGERFIAIGRVVRPGKKLTVCLGEVFAKEGGNRKQIALMTASMMVVDTSTVGLWAPGRAGEPSS
jgi:acyl-coenzyme A thioesterase PaaI-like protein